MTKYDNSLTSKKKKLPQKSDHLKRMGVDLGDCDFVVALGGNPNTGKSTVFNNLTGLRQHTGNWPGKTVTRAMGAFKFGGKIFKIVDLPGTYSLLAITEDEEIARDFILFGRPDVTVVVVDSTCLERNLNLVLQVLEITDNVVVDLNLMDEANRHHLKIDIQKLSDILGVPVVPTVARYNKGMDALITTINEVATGQRECKPYRIITESSELKQAIDRLAGEIRIVYPQLSNVRWLAMRLLDGDQKMIEAFRTGAFDEIARNL